MNKEGYTRRDFLKIGAATLAAGGLTLVGCGSSNENTASTPQDNNIDVMPNKSGQAEAELEPGWKTYQSRVYPYSISYPPHREIDPASRITRDVFGPDTFTSKSAGTINVIGSPTEAWVNDLDSYAESQIKTFKQASPSAKPTFQQEEIKIAGQRAILLSKTWEMTMLPNDTDKIFEMQAIFLTKGFGWNISLKAKTNEAELASQDFDKMLPTFKLLG